MRMISRTLAGILTLIAPALAGAAQIEGDYIEARTADVYTGPCFSNAEVFITGHQAVMAWNVRQGAWEGVDLAGIHEPQTIRAAQQEAGEGHRQSVLDRRQGPGPVAAELDDPILPNRHLDDQLRARGPG